MAVYSGKDAYVTGASLKGVQSWTANEEVSSSSHTHSGISGATANPSGNVGWSGTVTGVGQEPGIFPEDTAASVGFVINNTGGSLKNLAGSVFWESLAITWDKASAAAVTWSASWKAHGLMTQGTTGGTDSTVMQAENSKDLFLDLGTAGGGTAFDTLSTCLQSATLTFTRQLNDYVCGGVVLRTPGNLSASLSFSLLDENVNVAAYAANLKKLIQIGTGTYWEIDSMRFKSKSNFVADRTTGAPIGYTVNAEWDAAEGSVLGAIVAPSTTILFP